MGILAFHRIEPQWSFGVTNVTPKRFAAQMEALCGAGITFRTAGEYLVDDLPQKVTLTFDDGYESVFLYAFPVLCALGIPASVFINPAFIGQWNEWDVRLPGQRARQMDWRQIERLAQTGWEIGIHGLTHKELCRLSNEALELEICLARDLVRQRIGICSSVISYPFGLVDRRIAEFCRAAGFTAGLTMSRRPKGVPPRYALQRRRVYPFDTPAQVVRKATKENSRGFFMLQRLVDGCSSMTTVAKRRKWEVY